MNIAGLHKLSLLDYPEKLAAVVFTKGCNFKCGFCHNPELVLQSMNVSLERDGFSEQKFFEFLENRRSILEGVCVTGGEPLVQEDIEEFLLNIRNMGFFVKLDTNGLLFEKLKEIIEKGIVNYIAMDIKTAFEIARGREEDGYRRIVGADVNIEKIKKSIRLIMGSGLNYEFRTTVVKDLHRKEDIVNIVKFIQGAKKYVLQRFEIRDKILDDKFLHASSIKKSEAEEWKKECEKYVEICELRGWK
ncbi:MAG: anaerobic ribonucleoside-triphosphate reductase activating protein [bacterium]